MPLLKRKPVHLPPLPSLSAVLQPIPNPAYPVPDPLALPDPTHPLPPPMPSLTQDQLQAYIPGDASEEREQLEKLTAVFRGEFTGGTVNMGNKAKKGKAAAEKAQAVYAGMPGVPRQDVNGQVPEQDRMSFVAWKIHDRDTFYIEETGEIFTDYESYAARRAFYDQPIFVDEVTGKSSMGYLEALRSEQKEIRQLHSRFPKQLKRAILQAVQFRVEGKLEVLADKIFERFQNRFFLNERLFVDLENEKYLARIIQVHPPPFQSESESEPTDPHAHATNLSTEQDELIQQDDPARYLYTVKLVGMDEFEGRPGTAEEIVLRVGADRLSRDRVNYSRAILKRFIRDCVERDPAVYSPWTLKPTMAQRYSISTEMPESTRLAIHAYREQQMGKRKREREERLGLSNGEGILMDGEEEDERPKTKKEKKEEEKRMKDEKKREDDKRSKEEEEERKKKKNFKFPNEDYLVDLWEEKEPRLRPVPNKDLPFADQFEKFLTSWSFLNVMGTPLNLSPFTIDEFENALNQTDGPAPTLLAEIHACLLNLLVKDRLAGNFTKPLSATGRVMEDDRDYWEGFKGATTELLAPVCKDFVDQWRLSEIPLTKEGRKGWETALVGALWERASLERLPHFLDDILQLTFEPKPAPTRPTWSTAPSSSTGTSSSAALIAIPIPKLTAPSTSRYPSLDPRHKLDIIHFFIELAGQTDRVRSFMEDSIAELTEVRKEQVDVKREWKGVRAEKDGLEPKGEAGAEVGGGSGEAMEVDEKPNGTNGHLASVNGEEDRDELEDDTLPDADVDPSRSSSVSPSDPGHHATTSSRRLAMAAAKQSRDVEEAAKKEKVKKEKEEIRLSKEKAIEKKRLETEEEDLALKLKKLDYEFRRHIWSLRAKPLGMDRFGNRVWWLDAQGSAPMLGPDDKVQYGTGRLYLQGVEELDEEYFLRNANAVLETAGLGTKEGVTKVAVERRRKDEEGEGRLNKGEWGCFDTVEQVEELMSWLNPKGIREKDLLKALTFWRPELEAGITKRRVVLGLEAPAQEEDSTPPDEVTVASATARNKRSTRRTAGSVVGDEDGSVEGQGHGKDAYLGWKNRRVGA
ncbi:hypothetical protein L202_02506 [Cryptococcus amylolentus CBS 6039]|uniref:WAC domain-containing protein n=1 Tax=Cryptococcus amylolentus CBS 6039 TaxID=1295533 RepID=A0A1E3I0U0_9TREE|nr:hypothetical protein L202_02506 [Cryptococcus amylolentus CBS 6039]ODN82220.1 hypothetical protein L202_02506 [Cryptococcus amylolentus CBS 6039]